jgi:hypothetical protein
VLVITTCGTLEEGAQPNQGMRVGEGYKRRSVRATLPFDQVVQRVLGSAGPLHAPRGPQHL